MSDHRVEPPVTGRLVADPAQTTELLSPEVSQTILQLGRDLAKARAERDHAVADARQWERAAEERNGLARKVADLRDELATAREETAAARDLAEMRAEDRTATDAKLEAAVAERDALLPRLAELTEQAGKARTTEWLGTCASLPIEEWPPAPAYKGPMVPAAERDERQARLDAANVIATRAIDEGLPAVEALRMIARTLEGKTARALVGDQPTADDRLPLADRARMWLEGQPKAEEPEPRCCIGPFADGTHAPGCLDACQDCGGDEAGPHRCQCSDAKPVCTCTPSRCDYDGYPLTGPACLPCGQRPVGKPCLAIDDDTSEEN